eukprot:scaffold7419_cov31-Tisochrysis_lutea.AAC.7
MPARGCAGEHVSKSASSNTAPRVSGSSTIVSVVCSRMESAVEHATRRLLPNGVVGAGKLEHSVTSFCRADDCAALANEAACGRN